MNLPLFITIIITLIVAIFPVKCAPIEDGDGQDNRNVTEEATKLEDSPETPNPVQAFFENISKNISSNAQNGLNTLKEWFSQLSNNANSNIQGGSQNLPVMYMGSFQLLKMPMPQISDIMKGIGDLATAAQAFNKVTSAIPGLPNLQG